ncbi:hypothetical protein K8I31_09605, partial [bacterium]|nr:hypothetical protein [bacterium]
MLLIAAFAVMLPHFFDVQVEKDIHSVQAFADQLIEKVVQNNQAFTALSKTNNRHFSSWPDNRLTATGPEFICQTRGTVLTIEGVRQVFPDIAPMNWPHSDFEIAIKGAYPLLSDQYIS